MMKLFSKFILISFLCNLPLHAQTIAEKKAASMTPSGGDLNPDMKKQLVQVNRDLNDLQTELKTLYTKIQNLYENGAPQWQFKEYLNKANEIKENIRILENAWRETASSNESEIGYALWHQPDTTIGQLINDYGSQSYIYVTTPEISKMKISVDSNLPIPRSSWNEVLELILNQSGIGVRQLNPFLRELYVLEKDKSGPKLITNHRQELQMLPSDAKIVFVITPEPVEVKRIWSFLDKFVNPSTMTLQMVGRDILLIGNVAEVQDLLKIYDFAASNRGDKEYKAITISKVDVGEMAKILGAIFDAPVEITKGAPPGDKKETRRDSQDNQRGAPSKPTKSNPQNQQDVGGATGLKIIALQNIARALFLIGTKEEIRKAEEIIQQVENQVGEARAKVIYWYTAKHSDPDELGQILEKVYSLMVSQVLKMKVKLPEEALKSAEK